MNNYRTRRLVWIMILVWLPSIAFSAYMAVGRG